MRHIKIKTWTWVIKGMKGLIRKCCVTLFAVVVWYIFRRNTKIGNIFLSSALFFSKNQTTKPSSRQDTDTHAYCQLRITCSKTKKKWKRVKSRRVTTGSILEQDKSVFLGVNLVYCYCDVICNVSLYA